MGPPRSCCLPPLPRATITPCRVLGSEQRHARLLGSRNRPAALALPPLRDPSSPASPDGVKSRRRPTKPLPRTRLRPSLSGLAACAQALLGCRANADEPLPAVVSSVSGIEPVLSSRSGDDAGRCGPYRRRVGCDGVDGLSWSRSRAPSREPKPAGESELHVSDAAANRTSPPIRRPPFSGVANQTLGGSQPDWERIGHAKPPDGAPNVLVVLIDDAGPTRGLLLTGRNHHAVGMGGIPEASSGLPGYSAVPPRFPRVLKENGYSTAGVREGRPASPSTSLRR